MPLNLLSRTCRLTRHPLLLKKLNANCQHLEERSLLFKRTLCANHVLEKNLAFNKLNDFRCFQPLVGLPCFYQRDVISSNNRSRYIYVSPSRQFHVTSCYKSDSTALTIWHDVKQLRASPMPALLLGFSGLIPFVALPTYMILQQACMPAAVYAQVAYGACILSFLGGVRWGLTLPKEGAVQPDFINLGYSVSPSLVAWTGLLLPSPFSLLTVMGGLGLTCYMDLVMFGYPAWFKGLRFLLSSVAVLALWTSFMCSFILSEKPSENKETNVEGST